MRESQNSDITSHQYARLLLSKPDFPIVMNFEGNYYPLAYAIERKIHDKGHPDYREYKDSTFFVECDSPAPSESYKRRVESVNKWRRAMPTMNVIEGDCVNSDS
jgi:hypothetical protein